MRHSFSTRLFRRLRTVSAAVAVTALAGTAWSLCIWDTDTIRDELQTKANEFDLIAGQFPHHSKGYYEARVKAAEAALAKDATSIAARNDLAVALLKLGRFEESLEQFTTIETQEPGRYETRSNLGVLHKKWGKYSEAADYTAKALAIKPSGHLGLGNFYLKMLRWQADRKANPATVPAKSYLGYDYNGSMWRLFPAKATKEQRAAHVERIKALVRSDRTFADGLFVLGDYYHTRWDLNLALWSYSRALQLGHPNKAAVNARISKIFKHWHEATRHRGGKVQDQATTVRAIQAKLTEYGTWQTKFEALEAEMIAAKGLSAVDFAKVEAELKDRGVERFRPAPVGITGRSGPNMSRGGKQSDAKGGARSRTKGAHPEKNSPAESDSQEQRSQRNADKVEQELQKLRRTLEETPKSDAESKDANSKKQLKKKAKSESHGAAGATGGK